MKPIKTWPSGKRLPKFKNNIKKLQHKETRNC